jgi:hypothetical protein
VCYSALVSRGTRSAENVFLPEPTATIALVPSQIKNVYITCFAPIFYLLTNLKIIYPFNSFSNKLKLHFLLFLGDMALFPKCFQLSYSLCPKISDPFLSRYECM